jgi:hypothetical protein
MEDLERRVTVIETELKHLATKAWGLGSVVGGMLLAPSFAIAIFKLFP